MQTIDLQCLNDIHRPMTIDEIIAASQKRMDDARKEINWCKEQMYMADQSQEETWEEIGEHYIRSVRKFKFNQTLIHRFKGK